MQRRFRHAVWPSLLTLVLASRAMGSVKAKPWPMDFGVRAESFAILRVAPRSDAPGDVDAPPVAAAPRKPLHPALLVLIGEAAIAANAYLATLSPDAYGGLAIVLAPFSGAFCDQCNKAEAVVGGVGLGAIGAYNLFVVDKDELSSNQIFTRNFVAWHGVMAALGIAYAATRHRPGHPAGETNDGKKARGALRVIPVRRGVGLIYSYRY